MNFSVIYPAFISFEELTVILLFSVVIFGPKKIPEIARGLGEGIRAMKKATDEIKREIMNPVEDINPVNEIEKSIEASKKEMESSTREINDSIEEATGPVKRK